MSICYFFLKNYQKAAENAKKSIEISPSIKAYYRLG
jgi:hypothetical protein